jgi:hypothetical protein
MALLIEANMPGDAISEIEIEPRAKVPSSAKLPSVASPNVRLLKLMGDQVARSPGE